ncbi:MAG: hypothetical protein J0L52_11935 [Caulobacterales bacterium]|nr:hypothetical protein [Caulobacterales bacterium]
MDWLFETASGPDLADLLTTGLAPSREGPEASLDERGTTADGIDDPLASLVPLDPEFPEGPDPRTNPPPVEPPPPFPAEPPGLPFDYSEIVDIAGLISWLEDTFGPSADPGMESYDSLYDYMDGRWVFDIDPELFDGGGWYGPNYPGGYLTDGQNGVRSLGFTSASGTIVPIFREWNEIIENPPGNGESASGFTVIHHTEFLGFQNSCAYQVASIDGPFDWLGRIEAVMGASDLLTAWNSLLTAADPPANTVAISDPRVSPMNGRLTATVTLDGEFLGHVSVSDTGYTLYDRNGAIVSSELPLPQNWNSEQGVVYWEYQAHLERTMGVPFAQGLLQLGSVATGGALSFFAGLGFGFASQLMIGESASNATAYSRLLEAAYELRLRELRSR